MLYCPYCGTKAKEDEHYCIKCGKSLPDDMNTRTDSKKTLNKWWILPAITIVLVAITVGIYAFLLQHHTSKAMELYSEAEKLIMDENYDEANVVLLESLKHRSNFTQAEISLDYTNEATLINDQLGEAKKFLENREYKPALDLINDTEEKLKSYNGPAVSKLIEKIDTAYGITKLEQVKTQLEEEPSINELRILIWEAEEINHPEAKAISTSIRDRIIDYTFSRASEELNEKQFNDALLITEDGLKYAPESEKLISLVANINKEKLAFESAIQERIEQAVNTAYQEDQMNENDAIEVVSVNIENDEAGQIVIKGEVKSVATVPINSVLVEYALLENDQELLTNKIFIFPEIIYPEEKGKFEFTHFDLKNKSTELKAEVRKITWYTN